MQEKDNTDQGASFIHTGGSYINHLDCWVEPENCFIRKLKTFYMMICAAMKQTGLYSCGLNQAQESRNYNSLRRQQDLFG